MSMLGDAEMTLGIGQAGKKRRLAIKTPFLHRLQFRHFILFNVLPAIGTLVAVALAFVYPIGKLEVGLFFTMWLLTGLGVTAGYHRLSTHRSYKAAAPVRIVLAILGSMAGLGSLISWCAIHRRHHELADEPGDMHSPNLHGDTLSERVRGFWHAQISWTMEHEYPNIAHYVPDLLLDRALVRVSSLYYWWVFLGFALPAAVGGIVASSWIGALNGFLWGGVVRMFVVTNSIAALNSVCHTFGSQPFALADKSRNNTLMGLMVWGEGWHQNHHAFPTSASIGLAWYRFDLTYALIVLLKCLGLAWDVRVPTKEEIANRAVQSRVATTDAPLEPLERL